MHRDGCPNWKFEQFWKVRYQAFRRPWDDKSLSPAGIEPPLPQTSSPLPAPADCGSTWPSPLLLYQLFVLLPAAPLEALTSFFQLSAFTQLPVMKGGREPGGTDGCFHSNTKLQIWNLTWCMGLYFVRTPTLYRRPRSARLFHPVPSGVPRNFVRGGSTNSVEDRGQREQGSGGGSPLVRGSGGSCNFVQEI